MSRAAPAGAIGMPELFSGQQQKIGQLLVTLVDSLLAAARSRDARGW